MRAILFPANLPLTVDGGQLSLGTCQRRARGYRRQVYLVCLGIA